MRCECGQEDPIPDNPLQRLYTETAEYAVRHGCPRESLGCFHDMRLCRDHWKARALAAEARRKELRERAGRGE